MLAFLFGSSMFLVFLAGLGLMWVAGRHRKYSRFTKWLVFAFALVAGAAAALSFVGSLATWVINGALALLGAPTALVGVIALIGILLVVGDLLDGQPDGMARTQALILPTLLLATGGSSASSAPR
ncbi:hypothetical protein ACFQXA_38785 [Nocardiopsis composta]